MSTEELPNGQWRPKATEGAVPRRVEKYQLYPLSLPKTPAYARAPTIKSLGDSMMSVVLADSKQGHLPDPWSRLYEHRYHPDFSTIQKVKRAFPGLGIAVVAFGVYLGLEQIGVISPPTKHHHGHGHAQPHDHR